jgi:hypothetical protein
MHAKDSEGNLFHWKLELRTTDWLKLAHCFGHKHTARELYSYFKSLPVFISGKKDKHAPKRQETNRQRLVDFVKVQNNAKDWAKEEGLDEPTNRSEYFEIIKKMGHKLSTLTFMKNPKWMDEIPDSPEAEDYQSLYLRAQYDERITFPVDNLPTELKMHFAKNKGGSQYAVALVY